MTYRLILGTTAGGMSLGGGLFRQAVGNPRPASPQPTRAIHYQSRKSGADGFDPPGFQTGRFNHPFLENACASERATAIAMLTWFRCGPGERRLGRRVIGTPPQLAGVLRASNACRRCHPPFCRPLTPGATVDAR